MISRTREPEPVVDRAALQLSVTGRVQGVGFRPFVARTASSCGVSGWVMNTDKGITIEVDGTPEALADFVRKLSLENPPASQIDRVESRTIRPSLDRRPSFRFCQSRQSRQIPVTMFAEISPDLPLVGLPGGIPRSNDRALWLRGSRVARPAVRGTPRSDRSRSIASELPWPGSRCALLPLSMTIPPTAALPCSKHRLSCLWPAASESRWMRNLGPALGLQLDDQADAIHEAGRWLQAGAILAVRASEVFIYSATPRASSQRQDFETVSDARESLWPSSLPTSSKWNGMWCWMTQPAPLLSDRSAPIVLVRRRPEHAGGRDRPGLPLSERCWDIPDPPRIASCGRATAYRDEPPMPAANRCRLKTKPRVASCEASPTRGSLHDRPIVRHADDSVARIIAGRPAWLRLGRGSAPVRISVPHDLRPVLAVGGHLKSAVALGSGREIILGPHIGDLDTAVARRRYREVVDDLRRLHGVEPESVVCDLHPDYFTTRFADELNLPVVAVQHHHAHVAAVLAEHGESGPVLGIAWDGTGLGADGTIWGGEFLRVEGIRAERVGSLMTFPLVGGDHAAREPRRVAAGVCFAAGLWPPLCADFTEAELRLLDAGFRSTQLAVKCTSAGRLFDAWAALLGICGRSAYEAEAAIRLEECADPSDRSEFPFALVDVPEVGSIPRVDWRPWVAETLRELSRGSHPQACRLDFQLVGMAVSKWRRVGLETVVLGGGCFQNRLL